LEETASPVISCYLNLEAGYPIYQKALAERRRVVSKSLTGQTRQDFEEALQQIEAFITMELLPDAKGAAIFARSGLAPFFLPLQFRAPLPNWLAVNSTPNIYHLVELKDTYHRYVVMISTTESARILEVNLGEVTGEMWKQRPDLRQRVGREWTKEHYQHHRREQTNRFIKEKIKLLGQVMSAGGYTHLILAGNPQMMAQVRKALPKHLAAKLIDMVTASKNDDISDIVATTLSFFIEQEEQESLALVDTLQREINTDGLAVVGPEASREALQRGQVDVLVLAKEMPDMKVKEELVRMAEHKSCQVEVVIIVIS
jgi:protein required for attachment to host cells